MDTVKINRQNVKIVAHRGLSGIETENTASAFVAAGNRSYYGIETDIHRTSDGKFICIHDGNLLRVAGRDMTVEDKTLAEVQSITLLDKDGTKGRADLIAPALENYISICKKYGKHAVLELKSRFTDEETASIVSVIDGYGYLPSTTFISFVYENLLKIKKLIPNQSVQFLFSTFTNEIVENVLRDRMDIDVKHSELTKEIIDKMHEKGIKVNCWTVDSKERAEQLVEWGVDYITSNILE